MFEFAMLTLTAQTLLSIERPIDQASLGLPKRLAEEGVDVFRSLSIGHRAQLHEKDM